VDYSYRLAPLLAPVANLTSFGSNDTLIPRYPYDTFALLFRARRFVILAMELSREQTQTRYVAAQFQDVADRIMKCKNANIKFV
jgi:hypothetical protein